MAGTNDFLIFNENKDNMLTQDLYQADSDRLDGFKKGIARSNVNNKVLHQTSMMCHAFGELLKEIDLNASDEMTVTELTKNLKDLLGSYGGGGGLEIGDIGIASLGVDETQNKRRYLNGQIIIQEQFSGFTNKLKKAIALYPSLACTEPEWQATALLSVGGQVGKFVVDDEAGTIRLPKIIMPIQGLTDLSKLGKIVEAGLPNITGKTGWWAGSYDQSGVFAKDTSTAIRSGTNTGGDQPMGVTFDASRSSTVYGNSNTVQQEQIQYPYFIQVATGAETEENIINEIELNNPFSLLDYKYSEYELNNISWLRSNGQWNAKAVYPAVYDLLLKIYNKTETKAGVSVKLSTGSYSDTDFVLNTANETFRLPIKVKQKYLNAINGNMPVVGNGMAVGLTNGSQNAGLTTTGTAGILGGSLSTYGQSQGFGQTGSYLSTVKGVGITTDSSKSGIVAKVSQSEVSGLYLYFYVGETVQNTNLINAGRIEEKLVEKVDKGSLVEVPCITETYVNGSSWYRVYSDGWCEQGGGTSGEGSAQTVTLLKNYVDTNYGISIQTVTTGTNTTQCNTKATSVTKSGFKITKSSDANFGFKWMAWGYID